MDITRRAFIRGAACVNPLNGEGIDYAYETARMAAQRGARLVLAARNEEALRQLVEEIMQTEGAEAVVSS